MKTSTLAYTTLVLGLAMLAVTFFDLGHNDSRVVTGIIGFANVALFCCWRWKPEEWDR